MKPFIPFGMLFEEKATSPATPLPNISYDESSQLSYIISADGKRKTYIEGFQTLGTQTFTHVRAEGTDADDHRPPSLLVGTGTVTKVRSEGSDDDDDVLKLSHITPMGTETFTEIRAESSDSDETMYNFR